jgi:hypothetical protein
MDILQLRTELETLLVDDLGVYTLPNGSKTPAVAVRALGERLQAGITVKGLELVILREPNITPISQYSDQEALRTWTLFLVDWDNTASLEEVASRIVRVYAGTSVATVPVPEGVGPRNQMRLELRTNPPQTVICG